MIGRDGEKVEEDREEGRECEEKERDGWARECAN